MPASDNTTVNAEGLGSTVTGITNAVGGITAATPLGPIVSPLLGAVNGVVTGLLPEGQGGPVSSLLGGLGLGGLLGTVKGTVAGLPLAGPLLAGLLNNLNSVSGAADGPRTNLSLDQLQTLLGAAQGAPETGISIIANLGGDKLLTSAGTILQLPLGSTGDANSALNSAVNNGADTAGSVLTQLPGGTATGAQGALAGTSGLGGTLVNVGGRLLPLSDVLALLSGAGNNALSNPYNLAAGLTSSPNDDDAYDGASFDTEAVSGDNSTMSYSSMAPTPSMGSSTYQNPYPSANPSGTPSATQLVESMIARRGMPSDKVSIPVAAASGLLPSSPSISVAAPTSITKTLPMPFDSLKVPVSSSSALARLPPALPSTSAKAIQTLEAESEDEDSDDEYDSGEDDNDELWGDFVGGQ